MGTPIADQTVAEDTPWSFRVPANAFIDSDSSGLIYTASLADGTALPPWLHFDDATETFSGTPPLNFTGSYRPQGDGQGRHFGDVQLPSS